MSKNSNTKNVPALITIDFHGDSVTTIKEDETVLVAMKPIVEKLGIDWSNQRELITEDPVLNSTMVQRTTVGADGKSRKMVFLPLHYLNGWLFKINLKLYKPDDPRREVIIRYQRECYQVLHDYWHKGESCNPRADLPPQPSVPEITPSRTPFYTLDLLCGDSYLNVGTDKAVRQKIWARLGQKNLYFFPIHYVSEVLNMPVDSLKQLLSEDRFEIWHDKKEKLHGYFHNGPAYPFAFLDRNTYVTSFGMQRLFGKKDISDASGTPGAAPGDFGVVFNYLMVKAPGILEEALKDAARLAQKERAS